MIKKYLLYDDTNGNIVQLIKCLDSEVDLYNKGYIEVGDEFEFDTNKEYKVVDNKLIITDKVQTLKEVKVIKMNELKKSINYEEPVLVNNTYYVGGFESAQKLDAKRNLVIELGETEVRYVDANDKQVTLTLEQAKTVCLAVANDFETKFYYYKSKKSEINSCTTVEELEAVEI